MHGEETETEGMGTLNVDRVVAIELLAKTEKYKMQL